MKKKRWFELSLKEREIDYISGQRKKLIKAAEQPTINIQSCRFMLIRIHCAQKRLKKIIKKELK